MPYAERNDTGEVISLHQFPRNSDNEYLEPSDPEVISFLQHSSHQSSLGLQETDLIQALTTSDREIARVTEDLITLLVEKKVIIFTELPEAVQRQLLEREKLRAVLNGDGNELLDDEYRLI